MRNLVAPVVSVVIGGLLIAACSQGESVTSTSAESSTAAPPTVASTSAPTTAPPTTVPAPTSVTPTTAPPTTAPPTTAPAPTTVPGVAPPTVPATTAPAVTVPTPDTAVAVVDSALVTVDVATSQIDVVIDEFFSAEGVFRGSLRLSPDGSSVYFSEGYEDSWYQCESSVGMVGRIDVATAEMTMLAAGIGIELSPDGSQTVHLGSETCEPDPEAPELFVLTPYDRVVVTDLASGSTTTYVTVTPPTDYGSPTALDWADLADDGSLLVLTVAGDVHRIPAGATGAIQDFPVVATLDDTTLPIEVIGDELVSIVFGLEGSTDAIAVSLADGTRRLLASSETSMAVGVSLEGAIVTASSTPITVYPGAPVTTLDLGDEAFVFDLDW